MKFTRITVDPTIMGGVPCVRNTRIPVATIMEMLAQSISKDNIVKSYPDLEMADIHESLTFAAEALQERRIPLVSAS